MHYVSHRQRRFIRWLLLGLLSLLLAACSTSPTPQLDKESQATNFAYVAKADIRANTTQAEVEAMYGGKTVLFKPEAGFAILGFSEDEAALTTLTVDPNQNAFNSPEAEAAGVDAWAGGFDAWAGGFDAWAGGFDAWAGGFDAWAGGFDAWAGGHVQSGPANNKGAFDQIKLDEAHALSRNFGQGVTVAVIDSGIDLDHSMFNGKLAPSWQWRDYVDNDNHPAEVGGGKGYGHGTAAAGIILQVAPKAKILPIRVLNQHGKGDTDDVILAVDHAMRMGADIVNLSVGTTHKIASLDVMVAYLNSMSTYVVASAGNNGSGATTYPAKSSSDGDYSKLISVGSVNASDARSSFSSYGGGLHYLAPGENIASAYPGNKLAKVKGTSFAAPMVSGALALAKSDVASSYHNRLNKYLNMSADKGIRDGRLNVEKLMRNLPGVDLPQYEIVSVHSNKCVDVSGGSLDNGMNIQQHNCNSTGAQLWHAEVVGDYFKFTNVRSGKALDVGGASKDNGANVQQWTYGGGGNQLWRLKPAGTGYKLVAKHSGKCADVGGWSTSDGGNIQQWGCGGGDNQKFQLRRVN